jgi:uncharacterized membrane protein
MSMRQFTPRGNRRRGISFRARRFLHLSLGLAILLQIAYPLADGEVLRQLTLAIVFSGAFAMLVHAYYAFGFRYLVTYFSITFIFSIMVEQIGVQTGWPFGTYSYDESLGIQILSVPLVVPFAWIMMAHPVLVAARRVTQDWTFLYGGAFLMAWDLFLDPQMVIAGRWKWEFTGAHVPFQPEIPLSNAAGWLFVGMGLMAILNIALPHERRKESADSGAIDVFLSWTLFAGVVGNLFFFGRPGVAFFAGLVYLAIFSTYIFSRWFGRP